MGKVKQMYEDQIEAGLIDPLDFDGPGNPDTVGYYPGENIEDTKDEVKHDSNKQPF